MLILNYEIIELAEWEPRVKECCEKKKKPDEPPTGDCCYDTWMEEYEEVEAMYNRSDKQVTELTYQLNYMRSQRDMWKTWYDELSRAQDYSSKICHQLEILLHHIHRIGRNTHLTVRAIDVLYCMIKDFYMQLDLLKTKYDQLLNCIKCLNNPALAPNQGIRILIDDYGKKLDIVIGTRDGLIKALISIIDLANRINKNIEHHFGLETIVKEWKKVFHCDEECEDEEQQERRDRDRDRFKEQQGKTQKKAEGEVEDIGLKPSIRFPICNSHYYQEVKEMYDEDVEEVDEISGELLEETKERDKYKAWKDGLDAVIKAVDPVTRCATK